jgi:hypothetical protein
MQIVILNDAETYSDIRGCHIMDVPDDLDAEDIEEYMREHWEEARPIR